MTDYVIDPEIGDLLPELDTHELANLEASIAADGCQQSGIVGVLPDGSKILVDGHNRKKICADLKVAFPSIEKAFPNRDSITEWVVNNQLGRRNLTDEQRTYYLGLQYRQNRKKPTNSPSGHFVPTVGNTGLTSENIAITADVSGKTVKRAAAFSEAVDAMPKDEKKIVLSGQSGLTKAEITKGKKVILCERCTRVGAIKDCVGCVEARRAAKKAKKDAKQKPPSEPESDGPPEPDEPPAAPCDGNGVPWKGHALVAIEVAPKFKEMSRQLSKMAKAIVDDESLRLYTFSMQSVIAGIRTLQATLLDALPAYVCPYCDGTLKTVEGPEKGKACEVCCRQGWVGKSTYKRSPKGYATK